MHIPVPSLILGEIVPASSSRLFLLYSCGRVQQCKTLLLTEEGLQVDDRTNAVHVPQYR